MQNLTTYLNRKFSRAIAFSFAGTLVSLCSIVLIWGFFTTQEKLKESLSFSSSQITAFLYDKNLSLLNDHVSHVFQQGQISSLRIDSKETKKTLFQSGGQSSYSPQICLLDATSDLVIIEGCAHVVSLNSILTVFGVLLFYTFILVIIYFILQKKAVESLNSFSNHLFSSLDPSRGSLESAEIVEIEAIRETISEKTKQLLALSQQVGYVDLSRKVSHDLRSPLAVIKNIIRLDNISKDDLDTIKNCSNRIEQIAKSLLENTKSKILLPQLTRVNLYQEVKQTCELKAHEYVGMKISFLINISGDDFLWGNRFDLTRLFSNLINNSVEARHFNKDLVISIESRCDDDRFEIEIRDNGRGFAREVLDKLAGQSFITDKKSGNAIGLKSCSDYMSSNGGNAFFGNTSEGGAFVLLSFPKKMLIDMSVPIIVIDDDKYIRASWIKIGSEKGFRVCGYETPQKFLEEAINFNTGSEIYIDSELGATKGEDWIDHFLTLGFQRLNLETGQDAASFRSIIGLNRIVGKEFPY